MILFLGYYDCSIVRECPALSTNYVDSVSERTGPSSECMEDETEEDGRRTMMMMMMMST